MTYATCVNDTCSEHGIRKECGVTLAPGEHVWCGTCETPCEVTA